MLHPQIISGVHTQGGSQVVVGGARDIYFAGKKESAEPPERLCRKALCLNEPYVDYRESLISAKGKRVPGTCEWIRRNESYRAWLEGTINLLWISGGPGKGKTMISIFLTEDLERNCSTMEDTHIVHFFCSHQDEKRNTGVKLLESLIYQIIFKRPKLVEHVRPYIKPEGVQQSPLSLEMLWAIFSKLVRDPDLGAILCVIDGLDECDEDASGILVPRIADLLAPSTTSPFIATFRLIVVSRNIRGLEKFAKIQLDPDNNESINDDIENFISIRARELSEDIGVNDSYQTEVETALLERAEGTFLWVGFAMHELRQKETWTEVFEALYQLPSGLPAIYSRMLSQIPAGRRHISSAILKWVTMALRPLTLLELAAAVGVEPSSPLISLEQAIRDEVTLCGSFLTLQNAVRRRLWVEEPTRVFLIHQSARDYLMGENQDRNRVPETFRIESHQTHFDLAQRCFEYVSQSSLQRASLKRKDLWNSKKSPLLQYAVYHWPDHAQNCSALAAKLYDTAKPFFQKQSLLRRHWWESYKMKPQSELLEGSENLIHLACLFGIVPWIEAILTNRGWRTMFKNQVDERQRNGKTALHLAAQTSNEIIVRRLIMLGADVNAQDVHRVRPLGVAARHGNEEIVRLLLENGADAQAVENDGKSVLHVAAARGDSELFVNLLLNKGADIQATDNNGRSVLHWVVLQQNKHMVQLLLDKGADIHATDKYGWTVLHRAVLQEDRQMVQLLVDMGAEVQVASKDGETPLDLALQGSCGQIVQLLLNKRADIHATDKYGWTILHRAVLQGDGQVVQLLLDKGADVQATYKNGSTVLHLAVRCQDARQGKKEVVQLLLDKEADVHATDNEGRTVLHQAVTTGNREIVQLLLDEGADIQATCKDGSTVLHQAVPDSPAHRGGKELVQLLLDKGADIQATDKDGSTVLHLATQSWYALRGEKEVVQLLLDRGADVWAKDKDGKTAREHAKCKGAKAVAALLNSRMTER